MHRNLLTAHPPWRQLLIVTIALPTVIVLAPLVFAWPAARIEPRKLPIGLVGTSAATQQVPTGLDHAQPDGFDVHRYVDAGAARTAIKHREIYGALDVSDARITIYEADAAGPAVAQLLTGVGDRLAGARILAAQLTVVDVVPLSSNAPRSSVLTSVVLPPIARS